MSLKLKRLFNGTLIETKALVDEEYVHLLDFKRLSTGYDLWILEV